MCRSGIVIFGASGLTGSALCERLYFEGDVHFRAAVRTFGNAGRIARFPIEILQVDLLDDKAVCEAVRGCDSVVNCALGGDAAMVKGLRNLIRAAKKYQVRKFIHLSSTAIYGEDPSLDCGSEATVPKPTNPYGRLKKLQDDMIFRLHAAGVPSIILAAGHIVGPYSHFISRAIPKLQAQSIALVDDGQYPSNYIHVDNLAEAILTSLRAEKGWGERYFVTEPGRPTWKQFFEDLRNVLGLRGEFASAPREDVLKSMEKSQARRGGHFSETLKAIASSEFRQGLSTIPAFKALNDFAYRVFNGLSPRLQSKIRDKLERPVRIPKESVGLDLRDWFLREQVKRPYFAPVKLIERLGYTPLLTYHEGMESIGSWFRFGKVV